MRQSLDLLFGRTGQCKHFSEHRQFVLVQLQHIGKLQRWLNHLARIKLLPQVDVKNTERIYWRRRNQLLNGIARGFGALGQTAKADSVRRIRSRDGLCRQGDAIPGDIFLNREVRQPISGEIYLRDARRSGVIHLNRGVAQAHIVKASDNLAPVVIIPDTCNDLSTRAEGVRMIGEVCWSSAQLRTRQQ